MYGENAIVQNNVMIFVKNFNTTGLMPRCECGCNRTINSVLEMMRCECTALIHKKCMAQQVGPGNHYLTQCPDCVPLKQEE